VDAQQRELQGREEEMAKLRRECLREAIETSSQIGSMSTRLLALTAENVALKSRPRQRSRSVSVSVQEVEEVEGHREGGAGGSVETYSMHDVRGRDDGVRCDADSYHSSPASDKRTRSSSDSKRGIRDGSSDINEAATHATTLHYMMDQSTEGWNSDEEEVEVTGSVRDSHSTASKNRHHDNSIRTKKDMSNRMSEGSGGSGGSFVATDSVRGQQRERGQQRVSERRVSGVEALSCQMTAMEMHVSHCNSILFSFILSCVSVPHSTEYSTVQYSTVLCYLDHCHYLIVILHSVVSSSAVAQVQPAQLHHTHRREHQLFITSPYYTYLTTERQESHEISQSA
jgi:hypothetical protein